jgi:hypothetical protein
MDYAVFDIYGAYEKSFQFAFRHHPRCDHIIYAIRTNQLTMDEVDELFREADRYTFDHLWPYVYPKKNRNGTITFKVRHHG